MSYKMFLPILAVVSISLSVTAEDKIFKRKEITDTAKKLDVRKGDLTDTKKLLRKTDSLSKTQIKILKQETYNAVGKEAYNYAVKSAPAVINSRLKYTWLRVQLEMEKLEWHRKIKLEAAKTKGKLTPTRSRDYEKKFTKADDQIAVYEKMIKQLDEKMISLSKKGGGEAATSGEFFENTVLDKGARLTDKYGNFIANLLKGDKALTKHSKLDQRYYEVKYKGKIVFTLKQYFLK